jgi:serine protease Do
MKKQAMLKWVFGGSLVIIGVIIGLSLSTNGKSGHQNALITDQAVAAEPPAELHTTADLNDAFISVSKAVLPAVVSIATSQIVKQPDINNQINPLFRDFFKDFFGDNFRFQQPEDQRLEALGSGVIFSKDGYILTNNHVIANADDIKVELSDNRQYEAELIGTDPLTELAVIKIKGDDLPTARLGDSESVQVGEWVLAIGNPLRLYSTVTAGIISAKSRALGIIHDPNASEQGSYAIENFLQTDAAINPGNSGGALVNLQGEVIGINTAIATQTGGYQGYGFAVPINLAKKVAKDLMDDGKITRAWLGISMRPVTAAIAQRYGMKRPHGVLIEQVIENSPAEKAGLKPLDIIISADGNPIELGNQVQSAVLLKNPGDMIQLNVLRNGKEMSFNIKLEEHDVEKTKPSMASQSGDELSELGLEVHNLTEALSSRLGNVYDDQKGVVVTSVEPYGPAAEAGIQSGDLIQKIEDKTIKSVSDYESAIRQAKPGQVVIVTLLSGQTERHAFLKIPDKKK